jgi:hypothetical protein
MSLTKERVAMSYRCPSCGNVHTITRDEFLGSAQASRNDANSQKQLDPKTLLVLLISSLLIVGAMIYAILKPSGRYRFEKMNDFTLMREDAQTGKAWVMNVANPQWQPVADASPSDTK